MIECICAKCGNKWLLHNPNATCEMCPYCGDTRIEKRRRDEPYAASATPEPAAGPSKCPACGRAMGPQATHCIYCGTDPTTGRLWGAKPARTAGLSSAASANARPAATPHPTRSPPIPRTVPAPLPSARPALETRPEMGTLDAGASTGGGGLFKALIALLLIAGAVGGVWYFTRWRPNFTLAVEQRESRPRGAPVEFVYRFRKGDMVRTSSHLDMKLEAKMDGKTESMNVSLDYKQFTRITDVLPSGDYLVRVTSKFVSGDAGPGLDMAGVSRALANVMLEAELDRHGWIRPGSLVDMSEDSSTGSFDSGGLILRALPREAMAPGQVLDVLKVVPMPHKPIQGMAQFVGNGRPSLSGDCLFKGVEVRNGKQLAHLSIQALMVWEGEAQLQGSKVQVKAGVLVKGSCFYDIDAGIVSEVYLTAKMEVFANATGQGEISVVGTMDYYDFSDLNPTD